MLPVLRYRDLNIPKGETLRKHIELINKYGYVYWGWMKRTIEIVPIDLFRDLAKKCNELGAICILLFDSGSEKLYRAKLTGIHVFPGGESSYTPEPKKTPIYMAEADLPAWFKLSEIDSSPLKKDNIYIDSFPTLPFIESEFNHVGVNTLEELRRSDATLWLAKQE